MSIPMNVNTGITTTHPEYAKNYARWSFMRDVLDGEDTVKGEGTMYLPQPTGMTESEYDAYRTRAAYTGYTARTLDAMLGLVGKKKPVLVAPEEVEDLEEDVTLTGTSLDSFAMEVLYENLAVGRAGILVDFPVAPEGVISPEEIDEDELRPYFVMYRAEDILDWREGRIGNRRVLTYVKLREAFEQSYNGDPHSTDLEERIRIVRLNEEGYCVFELFGATTDDVTRITGAPIAGAPEFAPMLVGDNYVYQNGSPIRYVPFVFTGPMRNAANVQRPPLLDMAFLNVHHYQASADRNHAVHWADVPTPVIIGNVLTADGQRADTIKLGPTSAINLEVGGEAHFLEMQGNGITPTKELMAEYVEAMSTLGNKILASDSKGAEAAETAAIHRSGEQAILAAIANNVSIGISQALMMASDFLGLDGSEISYRLPTDYLPGSMDSQMIIALIGALQSGQLSPQEFYEAMVAKSVIRPDKTFDQHLLELKEAKSLGITPLLVQPDSGGTFGSPTAGVKAATSPLGNTPKGSQPLDKEGKE